MIRAVIDTNILLRALIKPKGSVGGVITALDGGGFELVTSWPLLEELAAKLALPRIRGKYQLHDQDIADFMNLLAWRACIVHPLDNVAACRDPDNDVVLATALAGKAQYIVTGDDGLLVLDPYRSIHIVTAAVFLRCLPRE